MRANHQKASVQAGVRLQMVMYSMTLEAVLWILLQIAASSSRIAKVSSTSAPDIV